MLGVAAMLSKGNRAWATPLHHVLFPEKSDAWLLLNSGSAVALCSACASFVVYGALPSCMNALRVVWRSLARELVRQVLLVVGRGVVGASSCGGW